MYYIYYKLVSVYHIHVTSNLLYMQLEFFLKKKLTHKNLLH